MDTPVPDAQHSRVRMRMRRSPWWLLAGIVAVCLGGLASAAVFTSVTAAEPALLLTRTVHRGEVIDAADLSVVSVGASLDVRTVSDARASEVIGQSALTDLPEGSLLVDGTWGDGGIPSGSAHVGLRLTPGRFPDTDLRPGSPVLIVALPASGGVEAAVQQSVAAVLASTPVPQTDGSTLFTVTVPTTAAEDVARLAAADRVALVRTGGS